MSGRRLTAEERERIIELRLRGVPVRQVAVEVGTTTKSVVTVMKGYLSERAASFRAKTDATIDKLVARHLAAADQAALAAEQAEQRDDHQAAARYLAEERARLLEAGKLAGLYTERVEQTSKVTVDVSSMTDDELRALLGER